MRSNSNDNSGSFLAGILLGGLVGAAIALWFGPHADGETRNELATQMPAQQPVQHVNGYKNGKVEADAAGLHSAESTTHRRIILDKGKTDSPTSTEDET